MRVENDPEVGTLLPSAVLKPCASEGSLTTRPLRAIALEPDATMEAKTPKVRG